MSGDRRPASLEPFSEADMQWFRVNVTTPFTGIDSFPLMAIPLFILAGNLMSSGGNSLRLVNLAKSLVGGVQGGLPAPAF